jgi:hypothetical protein
MGKAPVNGAFSFLDTSVPSRVGPARARATLQIPMPVAAETPEERADLSWTCGPGRCSGLNDPARSKRAAAVFHVKHRSKSALPTELVDCDESANARECPDSDPLGLRVFHVEPSTSGGAKVATIRSLRSRAAGVPRGTLLTSKGAKDRFTKPAARSGVRTRVDLMGTCTSSTRLR